LGHMIAHIFSFFYSQCYRYEIIITQTNVTLDSRSV